MKIKYTDQALKQLEKLAKGDKRNAIYIVKKIEGYADNPKGHYDIKRLKGKHEELFRLRAGDFRIIFKIANQTMIIAKIKHRQGAYND